MTRRKRILLWVIAILAVSSAVLIAVMPFAVTMILESVLRDRGADQVNVQNMDINPFTGAVALYGVAASNPAGRLEVGTLEVRTTLWPLLSRKLEVLDLVLRDVHVDVHQGANEVWRVGPIPMTSEAPAETTKNSAATPWGLGLHSVVAENVVITLKSPVVSRDVRLDRMSVTRAFSWQPSQPTELILELQTEEATLGLSARATPFDETLSINGDLELDNLILEHIRNPELEALLKDARGTLGASFEFALKLQPNVSLSLNLDGTLNLDNVALAAEGLGAAADAVIWQGDAALALDLADSPVPPELSVTGGIDLTDLAVSDSDDGFQLIGLQSMNATGLDVSLAGASVAELTVTDLALNLHRLADGRLRLAGDLGAAAAADLSEPADSAELGEAMATSTVESPASDGNNSSAYSARIGRLSVDGDNVIHVRDEAVDPVFKLDVALRQLLVEGLDTASPSPLSVSLVAGTSEADELRVAGTLTPFAAELAAELSVALEGFDLSQISAYLPAYNIERGRLNIDGDHHVQVGELELANRVVIDKLKIAGKTDDEDAFMASGAAMPLDVMLDLLRDGDDRIALDIPITGRLDSIEVGLNQIIRKATQAALQKAALSYVKNALQPLGTLLLAADLAGKAARPRFEPLTFAPGQATLDATQATYADKITELLVKRPQLHLTLCGVATGADKVALTPAPDPDSNPTDAEDAVLDEPSTETLLALAKRRADVVRERMLDRGNAASSQLFECRPKFEAAADAAPRIEITL